MTALGGAFGTLNWQATLLAVIALALMIVCQKYLRRVPGAILVCFGATAAVALVHLGVETIGTRFGGIPEACRTSRSRIFITILRGNCCLRRLRWPCSEQLNR